MVLIPEWFRAEWERERERREIAELEEYARRLLAPRGRSHTTAKWTKPDSDTRPS